MSRGFTLVEVLVALSMVAVALAAGLALQTSLAGRAEREPEALLAELCARNRLTELRLLRQLPPPGQTRGDCTQAQRTLQVRTTLATPAGTADFRQVQVEVRQGEALQLQLATVLGRY